MSASSPDRVVAAGGLSVDVADSGRDRDYWASTAKAYEAALARKPGDRGLLIQLGHAYKESGRFARAEAAYMWALEQDNRDADLLVQIGHFFTLKGNRGLAAKYYTDAVAAGSRDKHALHFLSRQGKAVVPATTAGGLSVPIIYLDFTDLVEYLHRSRSPTGIQRMELELFKAALRWTGTPALRACAFSHAADAWVDIDVDRMWRLCELTATPGTADDADWKDALHSFLADFNAKPRFRPPTGAVLVNLGPWWHIDYMSLVRVAKAQHGLRYVPFVHDIIPILVPEELPPGNRAIFGAWLSGALLHADAIACNSDCTRRDLTNISFPVNALRKQPVLVPLDATYTLRGSIPTEAESADVLDRLGVADRFVLFVGTLEARKNHILVFRTWAQILATREEELPILVCVGRPGWQFDPARRYLEAHPELADRVVILSNISDSELYSLYEKCLFTVFASSYEGWGLPVTEALSHGKVCLTANHSSLPEAGGAFAEYYEDSQTSFQQQVTRLLFDDSYRIRREQVVRSGFRPRTWEAVLAGLVGDLIMRFDVAEQPAVLAAPVEPGTIYRLRVDPELSRLDRDGAIAEMLRHGRGWHRLDHHRAWAKEREARVAFRAPEPRDGVALLVSIGIRAAPEPQLLSVRIGIETFMDVQLQANEVTVLRLTLPHRMQSTQSHILLRLSVDHLVNMQSYDHHDVRVVGIAIEFFAICWADDTLGRLAILEAVAGNQHLYA